MFLLALPVEGAGIFVQRKQMSASRRPMPMWGRGGGGGVEGDVTSAGLPLLSPTALRAGCDRARPRVGK